jgi:hypothetical protein
MIQGPPILHSSLCERSGSPRFFRLEFARDGRRVKERAGGTDRIGISKTTTDPVPSLQPPLLLPPQRPRRRPPQSSAALPPLEVGVQDPVRTRLYRTKF